MNAKPLTATPPPLPPPSSKPVPLPPPYENVAQAFERAYNTWKADREQSGPVPAAPYVQVLAADLVSLLAKVERFSQYGGASPETNALVWRMRVVVFGGGSP